MHIPTLLALTLTILPSTQAANRVFRELGSNPCQKCLATIESVCKGPIESTQFNNCFCSVSGKAWANLKSCVGDKTTECDQYKTTILGAYGSHCFAWKKDEEEELCVDKSQEDPLLLKLADQFCTAFVTPTTTPTSAASSTATGSTGDATTASTTASSTTTASGTDSTSTTDSGSTTAATDVTTPAPSTAASSTSVAPASTSSGSAGQLSPTDMSQVGFISLLLSLALQIL